MCIAQWYYICYELCSMVRMNWDSEAVRCGIRFRVSQDRSLPLMFSQNGWSKIICAFYSQFNSLSFDTPRGSYSVRAVIGPTFVVWRIWWWVLCWEDIQLERTFVLNMYFCDSSGKQRLLSFRNWIWTTMERNLNWNWSRAIKHASLDVALL